MKIAPSKSKELKRSCTSILIETGETDFVNGRKTQSVSASCSNKRENPITNN